MARDYDSQLLESVAVRRRRLRDAALFGVHRTRRTLDENAGKILGSLALAAVACAGCVGWSFVSEKLAQSSSAAAVSAPSATTMGSNTKAASTRW